MSTSHYELIVQRVPSYLGVKLLATLAPPEPSSTHSCERSRAEKWALPSTDGVRKWR